MTTIHHAAAQGFSTQADTYARGRPEYPAEARRLAARHGGLPGKTVVDLGAGTAKFTRLLTQTGATVIAVEPVDAMRASCRRSCPTCRRWQGSAESMPLPDASVDAVVCAGVPLVANTAAMQEIRRVLKPGGRLSLVWNVRDESVGGWPG
jgi:ubiquinone/menaquinone biosynthesis C-methylase UbiE